MGGRGDDLLSNDHQVRVLHQREGILESTGRLEETGGRINNALRIGAESEAIGAQVLDNLGQQRGQIERSIVKVSEVDDELGRSKRTMGGISRRLVTDKLLLTMIIVVLFALIVLIVYLKWIRPLVSGDDPSPTPTPTPPVPTPSTFPSPTPSPTNSSG